MKIAYWYRCGICAWVSETVPRDRIPGIAAFIMAHVAEAHPYGIGRIAHLMAREGVP